MSSNSDLNIKREAKAILRARWLVKWMKFFKDDLGWSLRFIKDEYEECYEGTISLRTLSEAPKVAKKRLPRGYSNCWTPPETRRKKQSTERTLLREQADWDDFFARELDTPWMEFGPPNPYSWDENTCPWSLEDWAERHLPREKRSEFLADQRSGESSDDREDGVGGRCFIPPLSEWEEEDIDLNDLAESQACVFPE